MFRTTCWTAVCVVCLLALATGCQPGTPTAAAPAKKPLEVDVRLPETRTLVEHEEFAGRLVAAEGIEIKARVSGELEKVLFKDGDDVAAGQPLFEIDARPYQAEFDRTVALVAQLEARVQKLSRQESRAKSLLSRQSISQEDYETAAFDLAEAQSGLAAARAAHDLAELNLGFTKISSRISGRISRHLVDEGNLVQADHTPLTRVVALDPIHAYFDVDERTVLRLQRLIRAGKMSSARDKEIMVDVKLADEEESTLQARFNFVDNEVDASTGTLLARAEIANPDHMLAPGLFVRLRVPVGEPQPALLIPEEALASDQGERYVYVANGDSKVEYRRVQVGWREGGLRVIRAGLESTDRVIISNLQRIRPQDEVVVRGPAEPVPPSVSQTAPSPVPSPNSPPQR
jgi:multidrug efflux system membrane fusion protein